MKHANRIRYSNMWVEIIHKNSDSTMKDNTYDLNNSFTSQVIPSYPT